MNELFNIQITNRIEIVSRYNFNKEFDVIIYDSNNVELYRTKFNFVKDVVFWIGISQLNNITINILDENDIIYSYKDINDDFVYITCGDIYYMDLIEKLVISLLNVSDKKIIVYGINCKVPFDYPNLIKKEITLPIKTEYDKWFWKQESCIEVLKENYNNYVWLDGDIIANINIDSVSKYFSEIENYPIGEIHVLDEQIIWTNGEGQLMAEYICEHFNIERKFLKKDLHACFFVFNKNCKWFFQEILDLYKSIYDKGLYYKLLRWNDETLHNFMHNKYKFNKTLPLSNLALLCEHSKYESNPKVLRFFYGYWNEDSPNNFGEPYGWNYVPADKNQILYFHENKNLKDADEMIEFIKMKNNDSFNSSKWFFIDKYNLHNFEKERLKNDLNDEYDDCKNFEYKDLLNIAPNDIVLDIGAGIGFFERYCYLKNASKIICFEPDEHKFELLKLNAHKDTILLNADVTNTVDNYIIEYKEYDKVINTYSIDYLFKAELIDKIDLLKIDNKGKEESILIGIGNDNLQKINKISIKWYNFSELDENKRNEIIDSYLKKGFNCFVYNNINFTRLYFYKKKVQTNLIESNDLKKKVISFSIYGDISKYTIGLLKNLELVQSIYTGWSVYVYYNNTVPLDIIDKARQFDFVELFDMTNFKGPGVLWRFIPHNNVERFISRDADSRISLREKYAVDEWIKSGKSLHIMRDHPKWHNVKIFAGMFGLVIQDNYNLESIVEKWVEKNSAFDLYDKGQDTFFLNEIYDKYLEENDIIAHDSYHIQNYPYSFCFPSKLVDYKFVGEIYDENDNRQEHYQDWINKNEIIRDIENYLYIYHHLGMGDHFVCNAIVRNYSKLYNNIFLFVKPTNYDNVKFMYRDLKNINYLVGDDEFAEDVIKDKKNVLKINCVGKELDCNFDEYFYRSINMDFEKMWTDYYCKRDIKSEKQLFDDLSLIEGEYIFIQEDVSRNLLIDRNRIRTDLKIVESDIKYSIFEYQYILENAKEIHLMESSFKALINHLNIKGILYFHKYMRYYPKHIESTIRNIKMITYE